MTNFILAMETRVKADQAKAAFAAVKADIAAVGTAAKEASVDSAKIGPALQQGANAASGALDRMEAELSALRTQLMSVTAAEATANKAMASLGAQVAALEAKLGKGGVRGGTGAAGAVGNLTAQFNDIGMMMAAGQNPLQLAIQQGSQITQVIGQAGAAGAVSMLKGAFLQMLNPVSLATYAVIAGGAALFQWAMSADGAARETRSFAEVVGDLTTATNGYKTAVQAQGQTMDQLRKSYGPLADEMREILRMQAEVKLNTALTQLSAAVPEVLSSGMGQDFVLEAAKSQQALSGFMDELARYKAEAAALGMAEIEATATAWMQLSEAHPDINFEAMKASAESFSVGVSEVARQFKITREEAQELAVANAKWTAATDLREKVAAGENLLQVMRDVWGSIGAADDATGGMAGSMAEAVKAAGDLSAAVDAAKREMFEWGGALSDAANAMASMVASAPGGGWLSGAIGDAATLAGQLWDAARAKAALAGGAVVNANPSKGPGFEGGGRSGSTAAPYVAPAPTLDQVITRYASKGGKGGGGGGGAADPDSFKALTDAAEKAMATLEAAVASIHEKVALGLMTTAEGTKAIASAKEQAATSIAELIPKLEKANDVAGPKAAAAVGKWRAEVKGLVVDMGIAGSELSEKLSSNFEKGFASFLAGAKGGKAAMADFKNFILQQLAEIAAQKFTSNIISPLLDSLVGGIFGGGAGGGGGTGSMGLPMPFANGGTPDAPLSAYTNSIVDKPTLFPMANGGVGEMGEAGREAILPIGDGGVLAKVGAKETRLPLERGGDGRLGVRLPEGIAQMFASGGIPAAAKLPGIAAYSGSIVDRPTFFPMAKGAFGLMGETEPEAVVPLARGADGKLGIRNSGGGGGPVTVNVINNAQGTKTTQQQRTEGGMSIIDVVIEQVEASIAGNITQGRGPMPDALSGTYGLSRIGS